MTDLAGGLCPETPVASGLPDRRLPGYIATYNEPGSGLPDRRLLGGVVNLGSGGGGVVVTTYYKLRARDSGLGPPAIYTVWTSTDPASSPSGSPVGSWVEKIILSSWSV